MKVVIVAVLLVIAAGVFMIVNNTRPAPPEPEQETWEFMCEQPGGWHPECPGPSHP